MTQALWDAVDGYIEQHVVRQDAVLEASLKACVDAGLPAIQVSATQGKLLHLLARMYGARTVLEVGTLGGYSTIWLARALPKGGRVVTLELDARHAAVARSNFERAGLSHVIELREGRALDTLPRLQEEGAGPFDLSFIDADKANIPAYFDWALRMSRKGSVIIVDNVVRKGAVADAHTTDESVRGVRRFFEQLATERRVEVTALQTVGIKGHDGFALALVVED